MLIVITGTTQKPASSERLKEFFRKYNDEYSGYLYIGYPIIGTVNGAYPIDAIWVSKEKGLVVFNLIEGKNVESYKEEQDDSANKIEIKLKGYKELLDRRKLCVNINVITFVPALQNLSNCIDVDDEYFLCNEDNLKHTLDSFSWDKADYYNALLASIQSISTIRKGKKKREVVKHNSRGQKLCSLEESIANLDNNQSHAVIETVEGVQRIRGLAGSGKTIVLALKAAYLHAQHPDWKIAVTFNTRSLKGQLKQLINTFYIEHTNEEPDWDNLQVINAWGAPGPKEQNGIYYTFCKEHGIEYFDYKNATDLYSKENTFTLVCDKALSEVKVYKQIFDVILVDEAQDFSSSFLKICYELLNEPKRLVYAYDELQNLNSQSLPAPEDIFGKLQDGTPRVRFGYQDEGQPQQDIILEKCYRNSRPALVTAHALGFGIYRTSNPEIGTGLVQMFEQSNLWKDIGYNVVSGNLMEGKPVILERTSQSSPVFLEDHSPIDDLIVFKAFKSKNEQDEWIASEIEKNIEEEELRPDDIIVINPNPLTTKKTVAPIRAILAQKNIISHTAGVDTARDVFFLPDNDSITFTGIYRAKGNEAAMVYVINAQDCFYSSEDMAKVRNQLFTAITRSKAWVRVVGVGSGMVSLLKEYEEIKRHRFTLDFIYPTEEQRQYLNIVNRDISESERSRIRKTKGSIDDLIKDLESGQVLPEDLGKDKIRRLSELLDKQGK